MLSELSAGVIIYYLVRELLLISSDFGTGTGARELIAPAIDK